MAISARQPRSIAFAAAGPISTLVGAHLVLGIGAAWTVLTSVVVVAIPAIRAVRWLLPSKADQEKLNTTDRQPRASQLRNLQRQITTTLHRVIGQA